MDDKTSKPLGAEPAAERDAWRALQEADPATDARAPREEIWEALVRARLHESNAEGETEGQADGDAGPARLHERNADGEADGDAVLAPSAGGSLRAGSRRRARWLPIAAAIVGTLVVAGGSFALGNLTGGNSAASDASLDIAEKATPGMAQGEAPKAASGAGAPELESEASGADAGAGVPPVGAETAVLAGPQVNTVFAAGPLPAGPRNATGYGFDAASAFSPARLREAAAAFGLTGTVEEQDNRYAIGKNNAVEASASVTGDQTATFFYSDPQATTADCGDGDCRERTFDTPPGAEESIERVRTVLAQIEPGEDFRLTDGGVRDGTLVVTAIRERGGRQVGPAWTFSFTGGGLTAASGPLAAIVSPTDYPLISPAQAVERLGDPRFAGRRVFPYRPTLQLMPVTLGSPGQGALGSPEPLVASSAPGVVPWPVQRIEITRAAIVLGPLDVDAHTQLAVPMYELSDAGGRSWWVVAVADSALDFG